MISFPLINRRQYSPSGGIVVLTCYLDDSDDDKGPVLSIGGCLSVDALWETAEPKFDKFLLSHGVKILHAVQFRRNKGPFKDWTWMQKIEFVSGLFSIARDHGLAGLVSSVQKANFKERIKPVTGFQNMSPIGYAFGRVVTAIRWKLETTSHFPLSFVVESGNGNNGNIERYFHWLKAKSSISKDLGSLSFVSKADCRAIQIADFIVYHGRRVSEEWDRDGYPEALPTETIIEEINKKITIHYERSFGELSLFEIKETPKEDYLLRGIFITPEKNGI